MGHSFHTLYTVDLLNPRGVPKSTLLEADSYRSTVIGGIQIQSIERVVFQRTATKRTIVTVYLKHGAIKFDRLSDEEQDRLIRDGLPITEIRPYRIDFLLDGDALKVTRGAVAAKKYFGVE